MLRKFRSSTLLLQRGTRGAVGRWASALLLLLALLLCGACRSAHAASAAVPTTGSVNSVFVDTFQRSLLAYQLNNPTFSLTLLKTAGIAAGQAATASGLYDFTVLTNTAPATLLAANPSLQSYPIMIAPMIVYYSLPTGTVGSSTVTVTTLAFCRIWRSNITWWSVSHH